MNRFLIFLSRRRNWLEMPTLIFLVSGFLYNQFQRMQEFPELSRLGVRYLFFVPFAFVAYYVFLSLKNRKKFYTARLITIISLIIFVFVFALLNQISIRARSNNDLTVHDSLVLTEEAIKFLDDGKDPYHEEYYQTNFVQFRYFSDFDRENPAMTHYVYLPLYPLASYPFYKISTALFSFYDQRMVHGFLFLALIFLIYKIPRKKENKILLLFLFFLNPAFIVYLISGYNDIFVLFWLVLCFSFLREKKYLASSFFLGLACISKQQAWLLVPLFLTYLCFCQKEYSPRGGIFKNMFFIAAPVFLVAFPFLIWHPSDFIEDVALYPAGSISTSYPISGQGFSKILLDLGTIGSRWDYYPFIAIQLSILIPLFIFFVYFIRKNIRLDYFIMSYAVFLFVFWFFSRFFNQNYFSFIFILILLSLFYQPKINKVRKRART